MNKSFLKIAVMVLATILNTANANQPYQTLLQKLAIKVRAYTQGFAQRHITLQPKSVIAKRAFAGVIAGGCVQAAHSASTYATITDMLKHYNSGNSKPYSLDGPKIYKICNPLSACGVAYFVGGPVGAASFMGIMGLGVGLANRQKQKIEAEAASFVSIMALGVGLASRQK